MWSSQACTTLIVAGRENGDERARAGAFALEAYRKYMHQTALERQKPCFDSFDVNSYVKEVNANIYRVHFVPDESVSSCCGAVLGFCGEMSVLVETAPLRVVQFEIRE